MDAVFFHGAHTSRGDFYVYRFIQFRHKNSLLLKIWIFSDFAGRVELGGAGAIGISASYD